MGQTIIVTGASRGIGLATCKILLDKGANVVAVSRSTPAPLTELAAKYPDNLVTVAGDVAKLEDQTKAVNLAIEKFSRLDSLILNAGVLEPLNATSELNLDDIRQHFEVNFFSCISIIQVALPYLRKASTGRVIFVSSGAAVKGTAGWMPYNASKAAINSLARTMANDEPSIVSVAVRPGVVNTDMQGLIRETGPTKMKATDLSRFQELHQTKKLLEPEQPGLVLANLSLSAEQGLSGSFVDWCDEQLSAYQS